MSRVFLTGATGMIGSNIAEQLVEQGDHVRALVREGSDATPLEAMGVEIVRGDIADADDVLRAADGCEYVIHSAAVLGGQTQIAGEHQTVNVVGTGGWSFRSRFGLDHIGGTYYAAISPTGTEIEILRLKQ